MPRKPTFPYPEWSAPITNDPVLSIQLLQEPARHYLVHHEHAGPIAYTTSPSSVCDATESKPGLTWWAAGLAADHILNNIDEGQDRETLRKEAIAAHDRDKRDAATTGSRVHDWIERAIRAEILQTDWPEITLDIPPAVLSGIDAFRNWWQTSGLTPERAELPICNPYEGYAGTIDLIARDKHNWPVIVDWKTSKQIYPAHFRQVGAYANAWRTTDGSVINSAYIVRLGKSPQDAGKFEAHHLSYPAVREAMAAWQHSLSLYRYNQQWSKRKKDAA